MPSRVSDRATSTGDKTMSGSLSRRRETGMDGTKEYHMTDDNKVQTVELASELTIAWLSNTNTRASAEDVTAFLAAMAAAVGSLSATVETAEQDMAPVYAGAVTARKSLSSPDQIISMIDGKPYSSLKRHLAKLGLTPDEYRRRYGLKADYPMVAPGYSERRRVIAMETGLGRKPDQKATVKKAVKPITVVK